MKNCLCCKVTTGSLILGLITLLSSIVVLIPLIGYYISIPYFEFISDERNLIFNIEVTLKRHAWTRDNVADIKTILEDSYEYAVIAGIAYTGATILASFCLTVAVCSKVRCLMIPFLILSMLDIILCGTVGILVVVALFYINMVHGVVATVVYVVCALLSLYCWAVVLSAYKLLGSPGDTQGYTYSPVTQAKEMPAYYPSAPQYFPMSDFSETTRR